MAAALIALQVAPAAAQLRTSKTKKGPRAIAVVRWQTDSRGNAVPKLLPVAILDEGKYYDASLYRATPRPMALDPGVVYEAQDKGAVLGYFTVNNVLRDPVSRKWWALGEWVGENRAVDLELKDRPQTLEVVRESDAKKTDKIFTESVDDRDIKKKTTVYDEEGRPIPEGQPIPPDESEKPSLKRKQGDIDRLPQVAPPKKEEPKPTKADDDPDRPKLKRGAPAAEPKAETKKAESAPPAAKTATAAPQATAKTPDDDPNRPILKRGAKGQQKTGSESGEADSRSEGGPVPARVQARGDVASAAVKQASGLATRTYEVVAVSDANEAEMRQDFRFRWTDSEREELTEKMRKLALQEATKLVGASPAASRGAKAASPGPGLELIDRQMAGLDVDFNNSAELVYSGSANLASGKTLFVTVVARVDLEGNPRKLTSVVTTSDRLDVVPRLELVDAVDADGDGRAELLFRRMHDRGGEYVLYRVGPDQLTEIFHGGTAE